jgi:hypothetical protein
MGEWRYSSIILDFGTRWDWMISILPWPLYPQGNTSRYPLGRKLSGLQSPIWTLWSRENFLAPAGNRNLALQSVALPTELFRIAVTQRITNCNNLLSYTYGKPASERNQATVPLDFMKLVNIE